MEEKYQMRLDKNFIKEQKEASTNIEKELKLAKKQLEKEIKLLLLGTGGSGKTTFAKQMQILHLNGFNDEARKNFIPIIHRNIIDNMVALVRGARKLNIDIKENAAAQELEKIKNEKEFSNHFDNIEKIWADSGIQEAFKNSAKFQLDDSTKYYMDQFSTIKQSGWVPTTDDVLRARKKTTGIIETDFHVSGKTFKMVDVGGQRSERRKWVHCFADVTAIIFVVAISSYDQVLEEDEKTNRMDEDIKLYKEIVDNQWFTETSIILFFNKKDIFEEKLQKQIHLNVCPSFKEYDGKLELEPASLFIQNIFKNLPANQKKPFYPHVTIATDTKNIKHVFDAVRDIIFQKAMSNVGF
eukprot:TRINITY_DN374_c0_g1_i1.p1 TRINITY_DN374_c0_g1~~TRINITY_DN374_c0_g1_i1.p1  ORF type:complete len:354 (-),score=123.15 TRINITY_DN374_c0_g1_i1:101-1162(-)